MTPLPLAVMARVDDSTARLLAGTFGTTDRGEREPIPTDSARMVLTVDQYRALYGRKAAAA